MEQKHSIGVGGDEDEIDCFSPNFDPQIHCSSDGLTGTSTVKKEVAKIPKKKMKTASFSTNPSPYDHDPEEEKIITSKQEKYTSGDGCDVETHEVLCGPAFDDPPQAEPIVSETASTTAPNSNTEKAQNSLSSMLSGFQLESYEDKENDIEKRMKEYIAEVEASLGPQASSDACIGTDNDFSMQTSYKESEPEPEEEDDKLKNLFTAPSPIDSGIDISSFRVSGVIEEWQELANEKTYANICEVMDQQQELDHYAQQQEANQNPEAEGEDPVDSSEAEVSQREHESGADTEATTAA
ncbi:unnamed protein product [Moneuplotes crassus]|uniref:Uncharacterized protein n=2 Tax=Euplotes crassus TaxID=5936 RepID=A0AAD1XNH4_EUPCR|nr:unnamed protein product [Moneuplotes crassus]